MLRLKSDCGVAVANLFLSVLDRPKPPHGSELLEVSGRRVTLRWKAPRDDGGRQVTSFVIERREGGRKSWARAGEVDGGVTAFSDDAVEEGRLYCYRIRAVSTEGTSDPLETEEVRAGRPAEPPGTVSQPQVSNVTRSSMMVSWTPPAHDGGAAVEGYVLERRRSGGSMWLPLNDELLPDTEFLVDGLVDDVEYEFRVTSVNRAGPGAPSAVSTAVVAKDPIRAPGLVRNLCVTDSSHSSISLRWTPPDDGDEPTGYVLELRHEDAREWTKATKFPIASTAFTMGGLQERRRYHLRVRAVNEGGVGETTELPEGVWATPPPEPPRFHLQGKLKDQVVVRAGTTLSLQLSFTGSPAPEVTWLKDGVLTSGREVIITSASHSQLLISYSERSDSGLYRVHLTNACGEAHCDVSVRITDFPQPPKNLRLEEEVPGTATLQWEHSADLSDGEGAHYVILKRDSSTPCWFTVAERVFSSTYTVTGLLPGRKYYFRVIAQNAIGDSDPLDSTEPLVVAREKERVGRVKDRVSPLRQVKPSFLLPLKDHAVGRGHDCTMSCAFQGAPAPQACWYKGDSEISRSPRFWHSTASGVCTLVIPTCGATDGGEYTLVLENCLGMAQCSCHLVVFDKDDKGLLESLADKEKLIL